MNLITLTTDFGTQDWFVGTMKGVILRINSRASIADLTHDVPAGDIRAGAFALMAGCRFFPKGTVHVAVVDPGVGSGRKALAVRTQDYLFVGPDNGVLSFALAREKVKSIRRLENTCYFLHPLSRTFHGRDIFAPVAAHLSRGVPVHKFGPAQKDFCRLPWPETQVQADGITGEVVYIDRFGNAITNIENARLPAPDKGTVFWKGKRLCTMHNFYQSVPPGRAVAVPGSSGFLEIAVNGGSAAVKLRLKPGNPLTVRL